MSLSKSFSGPRIHVVHSPGSRMQQCKAWIVILIFLEDTTISRKDYQTFSRFIKGIRRGTEHTVSRRELLLVSRGASHQSFFIFDQEIAQ